MTNKHDFTGKSIKCDTWEQMLHLAKLAREHGYKQSKGFSKSFFTDESYYFTIVGGERYTVLTACYDEVETLYHDFINPPLPTEVVEVTGCADCPFSEVINSTDIVWCNVKGHKNEDENPFTTCPLLTKSITIKLKQNDTTIIHTNIVCQ
jgi:hypothetical protein